jgi:flavodoxin short chain
MSKVAVVYWSGTGNTQAMAAQVKKGAEDAGAETSLFTPEDFAPDMLDSFSAVAFGCPSMGAEDLEETEFEPMFLNCKAKLRGKKIALFGSYGWGDGEWMRNWEEDCRQNGAYLVCDCVICNETPDSVADEACRALGAALAQQQ